MAAGRDAGSRFLGLSDRPTAVFCANDLLALGFLQTMYAAGVQVPDHVAIVGYDDIEFAAAAAVPLTSVWQPAVTMGTLAAEMLLEETGRPGPYTSTGTSCCSRNWWCAAPLCPHGDAEPGGQNVGQPMVRVRCPVMSRDARAAAKV